MKTAGQNRLPRFCGTVAILLGGLSWVGDVSWAAEKQPTKAPCSMVKESNKPATQRGTSVLARCTLRMGGPAGVIEVLLIGRKGDSDWLVVKSVTIGPPGKAPSQRFVFKKDRESDGISPSSGWVSESNYAEVGDFNFDGSNDFRIGTTQAAGPNWSYMHFLWDPAKRRFRRSLALDRISFTMTTFDDKKKEIRTWWRSIRCSIREERERSGCECSTGNLNGYAWTKKGLLQTWKSEDEVCGKKCTTVTRLYKDGKPSKIVTKRCEP